MSGRVRYIQSLQSIRDRCNQLFEKTISSSSSNNDNDNDKCLFTVRLEKMDEVITQILSLFQRDYGNVVERVPGHARWRHFEVGGRDRVSELINNQWSSSNNGLEGVSALEKIRRLLDLFVVSVLLDAGCGSAWKYREEEEGGVEIGRSEGLAVASFHLFQKGGLSLYPDTDPYRVDADCLLRFGREELRRALQIDPIHNPLLGEDRYRLLNRLGEVLREKSCFFYHSSDNSFRPGNLLFYLIENSVKNGNDEDIVVDMDVLWNVIIEGFGGVWPVGRCRGLDGVVALGDVWACDALLSNGSSSVNVNDYYESLIPFHKLSQWLTYSLMEPMSRVMGMRFLGAEKMTGLAEYRNGGLFVDMGVLELKAKALERGMVNALQHNSDVPIFEAGDQVIVQWRALTICLLDIVGERVREHFGMSESQLPLVKILEAGTWKAGREIAARLRPTSKGPPIQIISDGTVF